MTKEEKAKEYQTKLSDDYFENTPLDKMVEKAYLDGYEQGHEDKNKELVIMLNNQMQTTRDLKKENAELKAQIEKMKCCGNCKHYTDCEGFSICSLTQEQIDGSMTDCDKWEL